MSATRDVSVCPPGHDPTVAIYDTSCACGGTYKEWDCGCSWGPPSCSSCHLHWMCDRCHRLEASRPYVYRPPEPTAVCRHCDVVVKVSKMSEHVNRVHKKACEICGKRKLNLEHHVREAHGKRG